jgi:hypothetical protein
MIFSVISLGKAELSKLGATAITPAARLSTAAADKAMPALKETPQ